MSTPQLLKTISKAQNIFHKLLTRPPIVWSPSKHRVVVEHGGTRWMWWQLLHFVFLGWGCFSYDLIFYRYAPKAVVGQTQFQEVRTSPHFFMSRFVLCMV